MSGIDFNNYTPSRWISMDTEYKTVQLSQYNADYMEAIYDLRFTKPITKIVRAQNPYSYYRFLLRQEEYRSREIPFTIKKMYHATGVGNVESIVQNNLDWRRAHRVKYGRGVSFSPSAQYANKECNKYNGSSRVMIKCSVIVGRKYPGNCLTKLPPQSYDTTYGNCENVYVKYYDDEFYPEYLLYYTC